jgi:hypothetical protein
LLAKCKNHHPAQISAAKPMRDAQHKYFIPINTKSKGKPAKQDGAKRDLANFYLIRSVCKVCIPLVYYVLCVMLITSINR